jgi:2',3'-cyclic-nucleotide 2'-phosphodiesterase (5'-nucleotidase family)
VAEFPEAYQIVVTGNGELRTTTPLGVPPFVLAPGTSGKVLSWVNLKAAEPLATDGKMGFEVTTGNSLTLDEKVQDDPQTAALVDDYSRRMRDYLQSRNTPESTEAVSSPGTLPVADPPSGN